MAKMQGQPRIAFLLANLKGGGAERVALNLVKGLAQRGFLVDLVLAKAEGQYLDEVPTGVRVFDLQTEIGPRTQSALKILRPLRGYLREQKPDILLSHLIFTNGVAVIAKVLAGVRTHLILVEHNTLFQHSPQGNEPRSQFLPIVMSWLYPRAEAVVAVSEGMARDLHSQLRLPSDLVKVIYNPVVDESLSQKAQLNVEHPWFQSEEIPVLLAAGRLTVQKDFSILIRAFAQLREQRQARLLILGEGPLRKKLQALVVELGLENDVSLPGFVKNPYAYMSRAAAFVLSSRWEGLPTVLIEAIACGCQVVSTDCPNGPSEILAEGKYGRLVPVGDVTALAQAMQLALENPIDAPQLRKRSQDFSIERSVSEYLQLIGQ